MIKYDYLIERDEGDKVENYVPIKIPNELPNVVYLQGPNSSGKSTLLNVISLAFFGQKLSGDELNQTLREKLDNLINSEHQKIKFKVEVDNELLGIKVVSEKSSLGSSDLVVRKIIKGKDSIISDDNFIKEYKLIYDIPNDPLERISLLLNSLKSEEKDINIRIQKLRNKLRETINEIKDAKDPEQIDLLRKKYQSGKNEHVKNNRGLDDLSDQYKKIRKYHLARSYTYYVNLEKETQQTIKELEKHVKQGIRDHSKERRNHNIRHNQLDEQIRHIEGLIDIVNQIMTTVIDKNNKERYTFWRQADLRNEISHPEIYETLRTDSLYFSKYLKNKYTEEKQKNFQDLEKVNLLIALIKVLNDYRNNDITIPGVNISIVDFIKSLEADLKNYNDIAIRLHNIEQCASALENITTKVTEAINTAKQLKVEETNLGDEDENGWSHEEEIDDLKRKLSDYSIKLEGLRKAIYKVGLDPIELLKKFPSIKEDPDNKIYAIYTGSQLQEKLDDLENRYKEHSASSVADGKRLNELDQEIHRLEKKEPHKYHDKYITIQNALQKVQHLEKTLQKLNDFLNGISNIRNYDELTDDEKDYSNYIGKYLAKKVSTIRHIDRVYSINNIDVVQKRVLTKEGKEIQFMDLGTGQGQAAYLTGLLSTGGNKKIIALFDEVAMMDETSLEPIKRKLKELYYDKKLLMAIIVQKGESVKVESLI